MFAFKSKNIMATVKLTLAEKIDRAREGRTQTWIVQELNKILPSEEKITEVKFSRKKNAFEEFSETELEALSQVLPSFTL